MILGLKRKLLYNMWPNSKYLLALKHNLSLQYKMVSIYACAICVHVGLGKVGINVFVYCV